MTPRHYTAEPLVIAGAQVGEGPRWDSRSARLIWVDILGRRVHLTDPATGHDDAYLLDTMVGAAALRAGGGYVLAVAGGLVVWRPGALPVTRVGVEAGEDRRRPNDAAVDPAGQLLLGTIGLVPQPDHDGALYRINRSGQVALLAGRLGLPNGIDWSPDGHTLYFTDSLTRSVGVYDYRPDAGPLGPPCAAIPIEEGLPDGHTVDADGNLWVAEWSAGSIAALTPDGRRIATVQVPVPTVTSCAFGGPDLNTLFITTMRADQAAPQRHAGDLFACHVDATGTQPHRYQG